MRDISALNLSQPYNNKTLTTNEELHAFVLPVNGIPMTEKAKRELVSREFLTDKIQRAEHRYSNPAMNHFSPEDSRPQTKV